MFDNFKNLGKLMKAAGQARERMQEMQEALERETVTGEAGGGAVTVTLNGKGHARRIDLDDALFQGLVGEDKELAEELLVSAFNDGMEKVQQLAVAKTREMTGGMDLEGMEGLLGEQDDDTTPSGPQQT